MPLTAGYGFMNYGGSLKNIFIKPFVDVFSTAKGVASELSVRAKTAAKVVVESALTTFIPLAKSHYTQIFQTMKKSLHEVRQRYQSVYDANDAAFRDKDAMFLAFMLDPSAFLTAKAVGYSPDVARNVLEVFVAGQSGVLEHVLQTVQYLKELSYELKDKAYYKRHVADRAYASAGKYRPQVPWEGQDEGTDPKELVEADEPRRNPKVELQKVLADPRLKKELESTRLAQSMRSDASRIVTMFASRVGRDADGIAAAHDLGDLSKLFGGEISDESLEQLPAPERAAAEEAILRATRSAMAEFYRRSLSDAIKLVEDGGVPSTNAYVRMLNGLTSRIRS
jgi:hypothetical protein